MHPIAITPGEPAGIGPDIILQLATEVLPAIPIVIADIDMLQRRADMLNNPVALRHYDPAAIPQSHTPGECLVLHTPLGIREEAGKLNSLNAAYVLETLRIAVKNCVHKQFHALVTGPVQKSIINDAGFPFTGHTEFLGELTDTTPVMMLIAGSLRVALATTHLPLRAVSDAITQDNLRRTLTILHHDLQSRFGLPEPRIAVAGLNPHAGESGHLGNEEIRIIEPVIAELKQHMSVHGPLAADTLFTPARLTNYDAVLVMYHDQGLPVLKYAGFGEAVNITLGLPIIRTSVDHGVALDLAGTGKANAGSLRAAFDLAASMK
jgi:4-hydroxythreonine-4-phosphate dehydrogenase